MLLNNLSRCSELSLRGNGADGLDSQGPNLSVTPILKPIWDPLSPITKLHMSSAEGEVRREGGGERRQGEKQGLA